MQQFTNKIAARMRDRAARLQAEQEGAGVLEYSLVAAVISVALVAGALTFGQSVVTSATNEINTILP